MSELFLGMISGTSMDGVDAVLVELGAHSCTVTRAATTAYPEALKARLQRIVATPEAPLSELGALDHAVGRFFAECARRLIEQAGLTRGDVAAIGHHGQTIFHAPEGTERFTMQIGDPNIVAAETGVTTVADFRRLDMALGGQGAPLVPAFHAWCFGADEPRAVVNVGGIANITVLEPGKPTLGFDTGPGNTLLDVWAQARLGKPFDDDGAFGASGRVDEGLLRSFLAEPYFAALPPKSTGRELFHSGWLETHLGAHAGLAPADVQATLAELTAATIALGVAAALPGCRRLVVCGGGAHNAHLLRRLAARSRCTVGTTADYGLAPDWVEGAAFAWLARARLRGEPGNVPTVTGARGPAVLGAVYCGSAP
jgi:anhydro-N-acetylmuramic acid kinase